MLVWVCGCGFGYVSVCVDVLFPQLLTEVAQYHKVLLPWLCTVTQRRHECQEQCQKEERLRKELTFQNELTYEVCCTPIE